VQSRQTAHRDERRTINRGASDAASHFFIGLLVLNATRVGRDVHVDVIDSGIGIPEDELPLVTRKFVRGAGAPAGGSGLGLAIATRIATDHGGRLYLRSAFGQGTTVTVVLPATGPLENR
jgi:signal transduction histidine kinase